MLKKFTLVALAACTAFSAFSQKPDWEKVDASYTRLPLKPVSPMAKKYSIEIVMDADGTNKAKLADREALINSITTTNALLVKQGKQPQPYPEDNSYYPVDRTAASVKSAVKIDGCQEVSAAPEFSVKLKFSGFEFAGTTLKEGSSLVNGVSTKNYSYEVSYTYKISFEVLNASGELLRDEILGGTDKAFVGTKTKTFSTAYELEYWWNSEASKPAKVAYDNDGFKRAIAAANNQLNSDLGYTVITKTLNVATMKDGAVYADIITAFADASMGYNYLSSDKKKADDYLLKCVAVWEKAAKEYNPAAKKQRISDDVAGALYANLAVAYCFLEDWAQCNHNLVKLKAMDKGGKLTHKLEEADAFKADYEARIKANKVN
ncbi:hypothetical protein [Cytophaga aurantiaca]|uniref:hypothetical protein n=1 Tax=Cytophaga aurantiaca TaxID=29530 RepID=UPI000367C233|nr:hypothetical protein [Cytophaga aurantiaca]